MARLFSPGRTLFSGPNQEWLVAAVGDLDGDGKSDLIWENINSGDVVVWLMDGSTLKGWSTLATGLAGSNRPWSLAAVGDLDGDGKADLIWQNALTGEVSGWLMNGASVNSWASITTNVPVGWFVVGALDFDGDGNADLFWQNAQTGGLVGWLMSGTTVKATGVISSVSP
jgi:hypothetical protein